MKEAGAEGLSFELLNRNVDQPFNLISITEKGKGVAIRHRSRETERIAIRPGWAGVEQVVSSPVPISALECPLSPEQVRGTDSFDARINCTRR